MLSVNVNQNFGKRPDLFYADGLAAHLAQGFSRHNPPLQNHRSVLFHRQLQTSNFFQLFFFFNMKNKLHERIVRTGSNHILLCFRTERKVHGTDNNGFSGSRFSRQYVQTVSKIYFRFIY